MPETRSAEAIGEIGVDLVVTDAAAGSSAGRFGARQKTDAAAIQAAVAKRIGRRFMGVTGQLTWVSLGRESLVAAIVSVFERRGNQEESKLVTGGSTFPRSFGLK